MGEELVTEASPTFTELFYEAFPTYLALGMPEKQYWQGDAWLVKHYREAFKFKRELANDDAWLQGIYFNAALSVNLHNAFRKKGAKAEKYFEKPIEFKEPLPLEERVQIERKKAIAFFDQMKRDYDRRERNNG